MRRPLAPGSLSPVPPVSSAAAFGTRVLRGPEDAAFRTRRHRVDLPGHTDTRLEEEGVRLTHLLDDPLYLVSDQPHQRLEDHRDSAWVGGCDRCRAATINACERAGFSPRIACACDDTVVTQSLVGAGMGVAIINGLALRAHRAPGVHATQLTDSARQIYAATYGAPPDPPATTALIEILASVA
jgi:DNA-binding transcriptional LysR family regulator